MEKANNEGVLLPVKWRGGFADRNGVFPISVEIQRDTLDDRIRTILYNYFMRDFNNKARNSNSNVMTNIFLQDFYLTDYEATQHYWTGQQTEKGRDIFLTAVKDTIYNDELPNVFSFLEFWGYIIGEWRQKYPQISFEFHTKINDYFEKEFVGYRFIDDIIVPIIDEIEVIEIEEAMQNPYEEVSKHLRSALEKLADREKPDYNNSIKESISAVEAMVRIILDEPNQTLGAGLKQMKKNGLVINPVMEQAFHKLYGYTTDGSGIRHAGKIGGTDSTFEEAKFMLVVCSAFTNYLIANQKPSNQ